MEMIMTCGLAAFSNWASQVSYRTQHKLLGRTYLQALSHFRGWMSPQMADDKNSHTWLNSQRGNSSKNILCAGGGLGYVPEHLFG